MRYTAVTIGPIYKTMMQARKSRHLWGASYLFSFIMKTVVQVIKDEHGITGQDILLPYVAKEQKNAIDFAGTGLYPDRLFAKDEHGKIYDNIQAIEQKTIETITNDLSTDEKNYLNNYIRICAVNYKISQEDLSADPEGIHSNVIKKGNILLDSIELKEKYTADITSIDWSSILDKLNGKMLYKNAFKNIRSNYQFPSVIEIGTSDFRLKNPQAYDTLVEKILWNSNEDEVAQSKFLAELNENSDFVGYKVKPYHKYIAVVQADGDNIGKTISAIGNNEEKIRIFSSALFDFSKEATGWINQYGGKPVYVGGDDLFFFAPVAVRSTLRVNDNNFNYLTTIFDLIKKIDSSFSEKVLNNPVLKETVYTNGVKKPSLSYGVSIVYTKYPLNEARDIAYNLMQRAKKEGGDEKNKICFRVLRHSGQGFGFTVDKNKTNPNTYPPCSYDYFSKLCGHVPEDASLLSSLIFKLAPLYSILNEAGHDEGKMKMLFENSFNEPHHAIPEIKEFLDNCCMFINRVFLDFPDNNELMPEYETEERHGNLAKIYSTLRFLKMLLDDE